MPFIPLGEVIKSDGGGGRFTSELNYRAQGSTPREFTDVRALNTTSDTYEVVAYRVVAITEPDANNPGGPPIVIGITKTEVFRAVFAANSALTTVPLPPGTINLIVYPNGSFGPVEQIEVHKI